MSYPIYKCPKCDGDMKCVGYNYIFPPDDIYAVVQIRYEYKCDDCADIEYFLHGKIVCK